MPKPVNVQTINRHTTLIDVEMRGLSGAAAVYLVQGAERSCLIDAGTRAEAPRLVKSLTRLNAFPPDMIIITHAHHDHAQGMPTLRKAAQDRGKSIEVLASADCIPLLADPTYNEVFDNGPYEGIENVGPLQKGDTVNLGEVSLTILDLPGHSEDHIGILDGANRNLFVGDALGLNVGGIFLPPFVPPAWDPEAFRSSVGKVLQIGYETLCLTHFGCLRGHEAQEFPEQALAWTETWWRLFQDNDNRLDKADDLFEMVMRDIGPGVPDLELVTPAQRGQAGVEGPDNDQMPPPGEIFMRGFVAKLAMGYRMFQEKQAGKS